MKFHFLLVALVAALVSILTPDNANAQLYVGINNNNSGYGFVNTYDATTGLLEGTPGINTFASYSNTSIGGLAISVPEPSIFALLGIGISVLLNAARSCKRKA